MSRPDDECSIYVLIDPRNEQVRYVGATFNPSQRNTGHSNPPKSFCTYNWIQELKAAGYTPQMKILETVKTGWQSREDYWISQYANLLNTASRAGSGAPPKRGMREYKLLLPEEAAEWAKRNGGLSEIVRDCLRHLHQEGIKTQSKESA